MKHRSWTVISGMATLALMIWIGLASGAVSPLVTNYTILCRGFFNANSSWVTFAKKVATAAPSAAGKLDLNLPSPPVFAPSPALVANGPGQDSTFVPELLQGTLSFPDGVKENVGDGVGVTFDANIGGIWLMGNTALGFASYVSVPGAVSFNWQYQTGPFFALFGPAEVNFAGIFLTDTGLSTGNLTTMHFQQIGDGLAPPSVLAVGNGTLDAESVVFPLTPPPLYPGNHVRAQTSSTNYGITTGTLECDGYFLSGIQ